MAAGVANNPLVQAIIAQLGAQAVSSLITGGPTPFQEAIQPGLAVGEPLTRQLQREAAGLPTAATRGQMAQVRQQGQRMAQSFATSARRSGLLGPVQATTSRVQQGRIQAATAQAMVPELGRQQRFAQQQLGTMYGQALGAAERVEAAESQGLANFMTGLANFMAFRNASRGDPQSEEFMSLLRAIFGGQPGGAQAALPPGGTQGFAGPRGWLPMA